MAQQPDNGNASRSDDLVAKINMDPEEEPESVGDWPEPQSVVAEERTTPDVASNARTPIAQAIPLGLLALVVIAISMFLILQGVFEMIPD